MVFQCMFAVITPAPITGASAERISFRSFLVFSLLWSTLIYDPLAHLVWGVDEDGEAVGLDLSEHHENAHACEAVRR